MLSIQLLDLMHTLHTRAASIFSSWAQEEADGAGKKVTPAVGGGSVGGTVGPRKVNSQGKLVTEVTTLWGKCWCPLLQGELVISSLIISYRYLCCKYVFMKTLVALDGRYTT